MNIKSKQIKLIILTVFFSLTALVGLIASTQPVSAQSATADVSVYCKKKAKKAAKACPVGADQAVNKASYNCVQATNKDKCFVTRAKQYIDRAAKGNPSESDFKKNLKKELDKRKGETTKFNPAAYSSTDGKSFFGGSKGSFKCGGEDTDVVETKIDFGCMGPENAPEDMGPITDMLFAFIRFFSAGVGLLVVASIIFAGIQYSTSEGSPEATQAAKGRVRNSLIGLLIYIFGFSIIQFLVPGGLFT